MTTVRSSGSRPVARRCSVRYDARLSAAHASRPASRSDLRPWSVPWASSSASSASVVRTNSPTARPSSAGRPGESPFQNGSRPGSPGAGVTSTRSGVMSSMRQVDEPRVKVSPTRDSYTISSSSSPTRLPPRGRAPPSAGASSAGDPDVGASVARNTPYIPRSGMVPPLVAARRSAPGRPDRRSVARSHTTRARSSAKSSLGYRPASMSSTARHVASPSPANGAARRTRASSSPASQSSTASAATTCWARTSRGFAGTCRCSISPARIRWATTVAGTRSPRNVGNTTPCDTAPTWWPARPIRCRPLATDGGAPTWTTRSIAPMSMPSSSDDVATTAGRRPALSSDSVRVRSTRLIDPWWARASTGTSAPGAPSGDVPASCTAGMPTDTPDWACTCAACWVPGSGSSIPERSAHSSFTRAVRRSAPRRELVNTSVERCSATRSTTRSSTCGHTDARRRGEVAAPVRSTSSSPAGPSPPAPGPPAGTWGAVCGVVCGAPGSGTVAAESRSDRSGTGTTTSIAHRLVDGGCTTTTSRPPSPGVRCPPRNAETASTGRTVADSPMRWAGRSSIASRRSRLRARCAPRLVPATAWISSTTTVSTPASPARACDVRTRKRDSGVVTSTSGGRVAKARRSDGGVSPVRAPTVISSTGTSSRAAACRIPASGERRLRCTSAASALSGET
ncbi:hypothetical protein ISCU110981_19520 [Isoptericola cucumis]